MTTMLAETMLADVKVLDLSQGVAGPFCTKLLADYGAEVLKVERPDGGDLARSLGPFPHDIPHPERSGTFLYLNTNKRSMTLNLKSATGRGVLLDLAEEADILIESFRPGVMERLGLSYEDIRARNPRIVMTSISNFGRSGPYRDYQMTELVAYAMGVAMHCTGVPDREPLKMAATATLIQAGNIAAMATIGTYLGVQHNGVGQFVEYSILEGQASTIDRNGPSLVGMAYSGDPPFQRTFMRRVTIAPFGAFPCADGYAHFTSAQQAWFPRFCEIMGMPELAEDPRFKGESFNNLDLAPDFDEYFVPWLLSQTKSDVMEKCAEIAGSPVNTMEDVFQDRHLRERGFFVSVDHPVAGTMEYPGAFFRPSRTPWRAGRAPLMGEHTEEVICDKLGYARVDLVRMAQAGII